MEIGLPCLLAWPHFYNFDNHMILLKKSQDSVGADLYREMLKNTDSV